MGTLPQQLQWNAPPRGMELALVEPILDLPYTPKVIVVGASAHEMLRAHGFFLRELANQGVDVVCVAEPAHVENAFETLGARFVSVPPQPARRLWTLTRLLRRERPNIVLSYGLGTVLQTTLAARLAGVERNVALIEGLGHAHTQGRDWLYRVPAALADAVIVQNQGDHAVFAERFMRGRAGAIQVAAGVSVDLETHQPEPLPRGPLTFVMIARLLRDKGVYEFAEAARRLKEQDLDVRLVLVGDLEDGRNAVRPAHLDTWVRDRRLMHAAALEDPRPWIKAAHVLVLPSYRESLPRVVMEAMAMGRPCIVSDVPGCREVVTHHRNGIIIEPRRSGALVDAITLFTQRPKLLDVWSRAAIHTAKTEFGAERRAADLAAVLLTAPHTAVTRRETGRAAA